MEGAGEEDAEQEAMDFHAVGQYNATPTTAGEDGAFDDRIGFFVIPVFNARVGTVKEVVAGSEGEIKMKLPNAIQIQNLIYESSLISNH